MWGSPGRREMEGTNDCTVGRRQRPDIAHKASVKTKCTVLYEIVGAYQRVGVAEVGRLSANAKKVVKFFPRSRNC